VFTFIVTHALRNRVLVLVAAGVLVVFGLLTAARLPVDVFPDLNRPTVTIMTEAEGLAPTEVEQLVAWVSPSSTLSSPGGRRSSATASRSPNALRSLR
jgi:HME family heavy-metal exporter